MKTRQEGKRNKDGESSQQINQSSSEKQEVHLKARETLTWEGRGEVVSKGSSKAKKETLITHGALDFGGDMFLIWVC